MSLPTINTLKHDVIIPSTGKTLKFRPFIVKEYKVLLQAMELKEPSVFINAICDILTACTDNKVDIDSLTQYDVDYIFLHIRAKSIGELVPVRYTCIREVEKRIRAPEGSEDTEDQFVIEPCNTRIDLELNLGNIKVVEPPNYQKKLLVKIDEENGIKLRTPGFRYFRELLNQKKDTEGKFDLETFESDLIFGCIESIYDKDRIYVPGKDFEISELNTWVENLPTHTLEAINDFFSEIPYIALQTVVRCPICGSTHSVEIRTLEDFFV